MVIFACFAVKFPYPRLLMKISVTLGSDKNKLVIRGTGRKKLPFATTASLLSRSIGFPVMFYRDSKKENEQNTLSFHAELTDRD